MDSSNYFAPKEMPWGDVVNYITNPRANTPPNKAAGVHSRWSQTLDDNGAVRNPHSASVSLMGGSNSEGEKENESYSPMETEEK